MDPLDETNRQIKSNTFPRQDKEGAQSAAPLDSEAAKLGKEVISQATATDTAAVTSSPVSERSIIQLPATASDKVAIVAERFGLGTVAEGDDLKKLVEKVQVAVDGLHFSASSSLGGGLVGAEATEFTFGNRTFMVVRGEGEKGPEVYEIFKSAALGEGSFGTIYCAVHTRSGASMVYKEWGEYQISRTMKRERVGREEAIALLESETRTDAVKSNEILTLLHEKGPAEGIQDPHHQVVSMADTGRVGFLAPRYDGDLDYAGRDTPKEVVAQAKNITTTLLGGLVHMQNNGVTHGDINPPNILQRKNSASVAIADFGGARVSADRDLTDPKSPALDNPVGVVKPPYRPEGDRKAIERAAKSGDQAEYDQACMVLDNFQLGCSLYEIFTRQEEGMFPVAMGAGYTFPLTKQGFPNIDRVGRNPQSQAEKNASKNDPEQAKLAWLNARETLLSFVLDTGLMEDVSEKTSSSSIRSLLGQLEGETFEIALHLLGAHDRAFSAHRAIQDHLASSGSDCSEETNRVAYQSEIQGPNWGKAEEFYAEVSQHFWLENQSAELMNEAIEAISDLENILPKNDENKPAIAGAVGQIDSLFEAFRREATVANKTALEAGLDSRVKETTENLLHQLTELEKSSNGSPTVLTSAISKFRAKQSSTAALMELVSALLPEHRLIASTARELESELQLLPRQKELASQYLEKRSAADNAERTALAEEGYIETIQATPLYRRAILSRCGVDPEVIQVILGLTDINPSTRMESKAALSLLTPKP